MTNIKGYVVKDGKLIKQARRKSVSARIAEKKSPKRRYRKAGTA